MFLEQLSINIKGQWTKKQVEKLQVTLAAELDRLGFKIWPLLVSVPSDLVQQYIFVPICANCRLTIACEKGVIVQGCTCGNFKERTLIRGKEKK